MAEKTETDRLREQLFKDGLQVRREVLGEEYVNNAIDKATDFTWPGQQLITEYAWGTVWRRPGLDRKQRSLLSESSPLFLPFYRIFLLSFATDDGSCSHWNGYCAKGLDGTRVTCQGRY